MSTVWVVSRDSALPRTLVHHLRGVGQIWTGPAEAASFQDADPPDLIVAIAVDAPGEELAEFDRLLGFLRGLPERRRPPAAVLYLEPPGRRPSARLVRSLIDDRPLATLPWPLEPTRVAEVARDLLERPNQPTSLRERSRREWVSRQIELLYAGLDLPALRQSIDPRNAPLPVLLVGEPGTRRGLVSRYIHNLAEPARDELIAVRADSLEPLHVEALLLERSAGRRVTLMIEQLDLASVWVQAELGQLLSASGALGIEPIRWIASTSRADTLTVELRQLPWLRVDLPPVRSRPDLDALLVDMMLALATRAGRGGVSLADDALDALREYQWPGNLRELESVLDASLRATRAERVSRADLDFAPELDIEAAAADALDRDPAPRPDEAELDESAGADLAASPEAAVDDEAIEELTEAARETAEPALADFIAPLSRQLREPLLAIRTRVALLEQRPDDERLRRELGGAAGDLQQIEQLMQRLDQFAAFGPPRPDRVDLTALISHELELRQETIRKRSLIVLREFPQDAPAVFADEEQLRFCVGSLLDCAIRLTPHGGDLYIASLHHPGPDDASADEGRGTLRLLLRFHSPEDVLAPNADAADNAGARPPVEVVLVRALIARMHGEFAVDASGSQDNLILIELPA